MPAGRKRYFNATSAPSSDAPNRNQDLLDEFASTSARQDVGNEERFGDPFAGDLPLDPVQLARYKWGSARGVTRSGVRTKFHGRKYERREVRMEFAGRQAARSEVMASEEAGFVEPDQGQSTAEITQRELGEAVDIASAAKRFELRLDKLGPYRLDYTRNGRHLVLGGKMGHVASFDWLSKRLHCDISVGERVRDVAWLHLETMLAVAQKKWTYVYDNQGTQLHCLKHMNQVLRLEFLPYHFLLVGCSATSYLHWVDISIGKAVASFPIRQGRLNVMASNATNGIIHLGHPKGTVSLWSPNVREPLVKMLCHPGPVLGLDVDRSGCYMATVGADRSMRIWDLRQYKQLDSYKIGPAISGCAFSQRGCLAVSMGSTVQIFKNPCRDANPRPYLVHQCGSSVSDLAFCPYEDILGVTTQQGFVSCLIPGAGEPNLDALEANPYQSKKQRREFEVKALLDKIQPEMIGLESGAVLKIEPEALEAKQEARSKISYLKPAGVKRKKKSKSTSLDEKRYDRRWLEKLAKEQAEAEEAEREMAEIIREAQITDDKEVEPEESSAPVSVLDRFDRKKTKRKGKKAVAAKAK